MVEGALKTCRTRSHSAQLRRSLVLLDLRFKFMSKHIAQHSVTSAPSSTIQGFCLFHPFLLWCTLSEQFKQNSAIHRRDLPGYRRSLSID